jgi:hypothetical protein
LRRAAPLQLKIETGENRRYLNENRSNLQEIARFFLFLAPLCNLRWCFQSAPGSPNCAGTAAKAQPASTKLLIET